MKTASIGSKLLGAVGALFIATVMLVMSTVAWFTISKTPQASKIYVNVANTQNFEIAKAKDYKSTKPEEVTENDQDSEYTWGENITFGNESNPVIIELPVKVTDGAGTVQTVSFNAENGRTAGLVDVTPPTSMEEGIAYYTYNDGTGSGEKKCAAVMGMWLRTNTEGRISAELEDLQISKTDFNENAIGVAINIDDKGYKTLTKGQPIEICDMEASKEGKFAELIVYLDGDTSVEGHGVVALDVGGTEPIQIQIAKIKFTNSAVQATN